MPTGFPDYYEEKIIITPLMVLPGGEQAAYFAAAVGALAWPSANLALFVPFTIAEALTFKRLFIEASGTAANFDVGLYDETGNRLVSSGSLVKGTTVQAVVADITDTLLPAGRYYAALVLDAVGLIYYWAKFAGLNTLMGVREMAAAFPLPATATFAETNTRNYIPIIGATLQAA